MGKWTFILYILVLTKICKNIRFKISKSKYIYIYINKLCPEINDPFDIFTCALSIQSIHTTNIKTHATVNL